MSKMVSSCETLKLPISFLWLWHTYLSCHDITYQTLFEFFRIVSLPVYRLLSVVNVDPALYRVVDHTSKEVIITALIIVSDGYYIYACCRVRQNMVDIPPLPVLWLHCPELAPYIPSGINPILVIFVGQLSLRLIVYLHFRPVILSVHPLVMFICFFPIDFRLVMALYL